MPSFGQFELLEPIRFAAVETWLARYRNSERHLLLHKFSCESGFRERLLTMRPQDLIMLMRAGEENGVCFVITYDTPELRDFSHWVEERTAAPVNSVSVAPAVPPLSAPEPSREAGEFSSHVGVLSSEGPGGGPDTPPASNSATGVFSGPHLSEPYLAPYLASAPAVAPHSGPGEYTRVFERPLQPVEVQKRPIATEPAAPTAVNIAAPRGNYVPLVVILSLLALAALAFILYFLLRH